MRHNWIIVLATLGRIEPLVSCQSDRWFFCVRQYLLDCVLQLCWYFRDKRTVSDNAYGSRQWSNIDHLDCLFGSSVASFLSIANIRFVCFSLLSRCNRHRVLFDLGFALLVIGMGIYNGVWEHLIRRFISRRPISSERSQLLPSADESADYQSTSTISNIAAASPSQAVNA